MRQWFKPCQHWYGTTSTPGAAEQLSVHTNTIVRRRRTIEGLLGCELTNVAALTHVATALQLEEVIAAHSPYEGYLRIAGVRNTHGQLRQGRTSGASSYSVLSSRHCRLRPSFSSATNPPHYEPTGAQR
ncbi:helix-turn-helix domain-containing protein [Arthrobacter bambusae]|uniref:helix-turn-helix domain-containing protein n=1 Tax=Arthrobacter bambusae TaxID=1338426 RepID=UPI003522C079